MLENIERIDGALYFIDGGKKFHIKKLFIHYSSKKNKNQANSYLIDHQHESVIWSSPDDRKIIICSKHDKGTEYVPKPKKKTPWVPK